LISADAVDQFENVEGTIANCFEIHLVFSDDIKQENHCGVPSQFLFAFLWLGLRFLHEILKNGLSQIVEQMTITFLGEAQIVLILLFIFQI